MATINNHKKRIEDVLSIVIATYNHCNLLENTLKSLLDSPVKDCRITVLNNKSTDDTLSICEKFSIKFKCLEIYTQPVNLGGGSENYIHSVEFCNTDYLWHLADDDQYDFSHFSDVADALLSQKYDIIQVGAHQEGDWDWGIEDTPRGLYEKGYSYFRFSSFLPCDIFRYTYYTKYIKEAYAAISLWYPHMPCLIHAYLDDVLIYVSKCRIVTAIIGHQAYNSFVPQRGFILLSDMLPERKDKRRCIKAQMFGDNMAVAYLKYIYHGRVPDNEERHSIYHRLFSVMTLREKAQVILFYLPILVLRFFKKRKE